MGRNGGPGHKNSKEMGWRMEGFRDFRYYSRQDIDHCTQMGIKNTNSIGKFSSDDLAYN